MNTKYWYEFKDVKNVLCRVEILCPETVIAKEIIASGIPFVLEYPETKKLEPVRGSGAKIVVISESSFQLADLHTDDMQHYIVKLFREKKLIWTGWMDSEIYSEDFSKSVNYEVEYSASDFNILDRLKFTNNSDEKFTDINTLFMQLKRCFNKLKLPFYKLYIGCSTSANGISAENTETVLHKTFIQSSNFYDEDGEPMTCREVIQAILEPFGLMIVQRDASLYIYDYNTIIGSNSFKKFDYATMRYESDETIKTELGDLHEIGFASTNSSMGYEEMINNTEIKSSVYSCIPIVKEEIIKDNMSDLYETKENVNFKKELFRVSKGWENNGLGYVLYTNKNSLNDFLAGACMPYNYSGNGLKTIFRLKAKEYIINTSGGYMLNVKIKTLVNTKENPFNNNEETEQTPLARMSELYCNLYTVDEDGNKLKYYDNIGWFPAGWIQCGQEMPQGRLCLRYCNQQPESGTVLNSWKTNSNVPTAYMGGGFLKNIKPKDSGTGLNIPLSGIHSRIVLEITNKCDLINPFSTTVEHYPADKVKEFICNNAEITILDSEGNEVSTDDYEFVSYINKKVKTDFEKKELLLSTANSDLIPCGRGNILKKTGNNYPLQLDFTRKGQNGNLEKLLMGTIHSNYSKKNVRLEVDVNYTENPVMKKCTCLGVFKDKIFNINGCSIDFKNLITTIQVSEFSEDNTAASSIPYDE